MSSGASRRCPGVVRRAGVLDELQLAGGGADSPVWVEVLTGCTGLPRGDDDPGQAASAGAALLAAAPSGSSGDLGVFDPVVARTEPDPDVVRRYAAPGRSRPDRIYGHHPRLAGW